MYLFTVDYVRRLLLREHMAEHGIVPRYTGDAVRYTGDEVRGRYTGAALGAFDLNGFHTVHTVDNK